MREMSKRKTRQQLDHEIKAALAQSLTYYPGGEGGGGSRRGRGTAIVLPHPRTSTSCVRCGQYHTAAEHKRHGKSIAGTAKPRAKAKPKAKAKPRATAKPRTSARPRTKAKPRAKAKAKPRAKPGARSASSPKSAWRSTTGAAATSAATSDRATATSHRDGYSRPAGMPPPRPITSNQPLTATFQAMDHVDGPGRYGASKVFIAAIWDKIGHRIGMSLDQYKRWLVAANREQYLDLARADTRGDMPADMLERSEIVDLGAAFHFVVDRAAQKFSST